MNFYDHHVATGQTAKTRAKDSDRTATCQILDTALSEGQLSMAEHAERVRAATNAATLGDLRSLVGDLQTANAPVQLPSFKAARSAPAPGARWGTRLAVAAALVLLGVVIGWGLYGNTGSPLDLTPDPGAQPDGVAAVVLTPPRQLQSLGGLNGLLEQMRQRFGDTTGHELTVFPDYAILTRPDTEDERRELSYTYRGGWGDPSAGPRGSGDVVIDLGKLDTTAIVGVLRGAPETLNIRAAEVRNTYLIVRPARDPTTPGAATVSIYVSSEFGSGYIEVGPDGSVKRISYP